MYLIDGLFIIILAISFQIWTAEMLSIILEIFPELLTFEALMVQSSDASLSPFERMEINMQIRAQADVIIPLIENGYTFINRSMYLFTIIYCYLIRHVMEIIFSKLRNKVVEIFTVEKLFTVVSCSVFLYLQIR
jgi:hypothetical protein